MKNLEGPRKQQIPPSLMLATVKRELGVRHRLEWNTKSGGWEAKVRNWEMVNMASAGNEYTVQDQADDKEDLSSEEKWDN